ncbi:type II secretion system F family protein [Cellulomonas sp. CW35]|uniref:type II secretion system F family protein n=1 Tax=Cellulomonas sp. CW35 TaxID=3458249 RepID=UPI00403486F9
MSVVVGMASAAAVLVVAGVGPRRALLRTSAPDPSPRGDAPGSDRDLEDVLVAVGAQLRAGRPPGAAWASALGRPVDGDVPELAALVAACGRRGRLGGRDDERLVERAAAVVAAARTAHELGAPLAAMLLHVSDSLAADAAERDDVEAALAGPRATARVLGWLPVLGVGLGALLGADPLAVLLGGGLGSVAGVAGVVLLLVGRGWTRRLVARAARGGG